MEVCAAPAFLPLPSPQGPSTPFALGALVPCGPLKLGRPQAVEFPGRRWELRGAGGERAGKEGKPQARMALGAQHFLASAAPSSGRGRFHSYEPSCGWKADGGKAGSLTLSPCGWDTLRGRSTSPPNRPPEPIVH